MTVYDLNRDQIDILKCAYFYSDDTSDCIDDEIVYPEQIPDEIIFTNYSGIDFVADDFA